MHCGIASILCVCVCVCVCLDFLVSSFSCTIPSFIVIIILFVCVEHPLDIRLFFPCLILVIPFPPDGQSRLPKRKPVFVGGQGVPDIVLEYVESGIDCVESRYVRFF